jgi:hypothetical protein
MIAASRQRMTPIKTILAIASLALLGVVMGLGINAFRGGQAMPGAVERMPVTINNLRLNVPRDFFRGGTPPRTGTSERIDLLALFPEMSSAGVPPATTMALTAQDPRRLVFIAVLRGDGVLDPSERPQELYGRFLEPDTWQNPGGLLLRRFEAGSPYEDEELFIAPPDGRVFAARCRKPGKGTESIGEACLWRFRQAGADVQIRFSVDLLPQWEPMAMGVGRLLETWTAK